MLKDANKNINSTKKDIAIIGMNARFPKANNVYDFWQNIRDGVDCIGEFPGCRKKDANRYLKYYKNVKSQINYKLGGYIDEIDKFDYEFFKISPKEARLIDPNQRIFLETALSAIEDAGYGGKKLQGTRTGVYVGFRSYKQKYWEMIEKVDPSSMTIAFSRNSAAMIPSRISNLFDLFGPAIVIDTACSSALVSVHLACSGIINGDCDYAIAGGITLEELPVFEDERIGIESKDDKTRTFDDDASGTVSSEGVACVLLKSLEHALADKDNIHAVIKGTAINNDGRTFGITVPNANMQEDAILRAWKNANIDPETITYIEAHGTATRLGDPTELLGIRKAFERFTNKKQFCAIGSVMSNIGHSNAVAGLAGLIKSVMALKNKQIPPTINFNKPNKKITFHNSPVYVNDSLVEWEAINGSRRCGVSSFGLSGTNSHLVLEEAPLVENKSNDLNVQVLTLSAKSEISLKGLINEYNKFLQGIKEISLTNICFTVNTGRGHYSHRIAIITNSIEDLKVKISELNCMKILSKSNNKSYLYYNISNHKGNVNNDDMSESLKDLNFALIKNLKNSEKRIAILLHDICEYYVNGGKLDWEQLYNKIDVRRVSVPTYFFEKKRCWLEINEAIEPPTDTSLNHLYNAAFWEEKPIDLKNCNDAGEGITLIFSNTKGIEKQLSEKLSDEGKNVIEVFKGDTFNRINERSFIIDSSIDSLTTLMSTIPLEKLDKIIYIQPIHHYAENTDTEIQKKVKLDAGLSFFYNIIKSIKNLKSKIDIIIISEYAYDVTEDESVIIPENAALIGFSKAVTWEFSGFKCRCIDIDKNTNIDSIIKEIKYGSKEYIVAYRNGYRYVERIKNINISNAMSNSLKFKDNGVYVITGGAGGIGLELSSFLASKYSVKLALINRTSIYDLNNKNSEEQYNLLNKQKKIREIEDLGAIVKLYTADVSQKDAMDKVFEQIKSEYGKIDGVLHIAGINSSGTISNQNLDEFSGALLSKVQGTRILEDLTKSDNLDFFILFSSIITLVGGKGAGGYTAANSYLDSFAAYRNKLGKKTLTINWPVWDNIGFSEDRLSNDKDIFKAIEVNDAFELLEKSVKTDFSRMIIGEVNRNSKVYEIMEHLPFKFSKELESVALSSKKKVVGSVFYRDRNWVEKVEVESFENSKVSDTEEKIAQVWGRILGYEKINVNDNFFELGGDSIFAVEMEVELEDIGINVTYMDIYEHPTLKGLSMYVNDEYYSFNDKVCDVLPKKNNIKNQLHERNTKMVIGNFDPFNEIFFKEDCLYNSFIPIIRSYNKNIIPFLFTDIIIYGHCISKKGEKDIQYIQIYEIEKVFSDMGILVETNVKSNDIVCNIKQAIDKSRPVVLFIDSYYESIREDTYNKYHLPHTLLILGYDNENQVFNIIEHDDRDSLSYNNCTIGYTDIKNCYEGYLKLFYDKDKFPSYFEFYLDNSNQNHEYYTKVLNDSIHRFASFMVEKQEDIYIGLKHIIKLADEFKFNIIGNKNNDKSLENFVNRLNNIIIARQSEYYRLQQVFSTDEFMLNRLSKIIHFWIVIRAKLTKCIFRPVHRNKDIESYVEKIYQIYNLEIDFHEKLISLLKKEINQYNANNSN